MMRMQGGLTAVLGGLTAAMVLSGCSDESPERAPAPVSATGPPAASESAATTEAPADDAETTAEPELSTDEADQAAIEETLQAYNTALGRAVVGEDSVEEIYPYSRDAAREQWVMQVMAYEAQGITFSGQSALEVLDISVDGDAAQAVACADVSGIKAIDANGDSFITDNRLDQTLNDFVLERDDSAEFGWYIVEDTNRNEPCDG